MLSEPVRECLVIFISSLMLMVHLKQNWTMSNEVDTGNYIQQVEDGKRSDNAENR